MDPISAAGAIISFASFGVRASELGYKAYKQIREDGDLKANINNYGRPLGLALSSGLFEAGNVVNRIRRHVIGKNNDEVRMFRKSWTESFTMIGVAGAITAQIAFSGLSLLHLYKTHWTAYAAFIVSLIAGILSVYFSCSMQLLLSGLHGSGEIRDWLTKPTISYLPSQQAKAKAPKVPDIRLAGTRVERIPSLNAACMLVAPSSLLSISLAALLVGLGIYIGFLYTSHLGETSGKRSGLAILIVYIVFTTLFLFFYAYPSGMKTFETLLTRGEREFLDLDETVEHSEQLEQTTSPVAPERYIAVLAVIIRNQEEQLGALRALSSPASTVNDRTRTRYNPVMM